MVPAINVTDAANYYDGEKRSGLVEKQAAAAADSELADDLAAANAKLAEYKTDPST